MTPDRPANLAELRALVARSRTVRPVGTGHSYSGLTQTSGTPVSVAGLPSTMDIDAAARTVTLAGGVRYAELAGYLHRNGYALANLASLPHICVAGGCATGTHGSGDRNRGLAAAVRSMELVTAGGDLATVDGPAVAVHLGALGVVVRLTLDVVPAFEVRQDVYDDLPWETFLDRFDEVFAAGYSVSAFTDWDGRLVRQVWVKRVASGAGPRVPDQLGARLADVPAHAEWLGARLAGSPRHPIAGLSPVHCTEQLGRPGPWHQRLPHFRADYTPSAGDELQSEYLLPRASAVEALGALCAVRDRIVGALRVSEVRTVAADEVWLSPCYRRDTVAVHFTWVSDAAAVVPAVAAVEEALEPYGPRPHWGKLFRIGPDALRQRYERLADFVRLAKEYDPAGKFRNPMLDRYLVG